MKTQSILLQKKYIRGLVDSYSVIWIQKGIQHLVPDKVVTQELHLHTHPCVRGKFGAKSDTLGYLKSWPHKQRAPKLQLKAHLSNWFHQLTGGHAGHPTAVPATELPFQPKMEFCHHYYSCRAESGFSISNSTGSLQVFMIHYRQVFFLSLVFGL